MSSKVGSRPCGSCATRTSSAISELSQGGPLRCQTCEQPNSTRRILMTSVAVQPFSGTYRAQPVPSSFAFAVRHSGVFWYRGSLSDVAATLRARRRRAGARGVRARRVHLRGRASRDAGERARSGVLRRRAPSRDHVPLDGGPPRRRRPGRGRRRAHDPGRHAPGHRHRSLRPTATEPASARSRDCSSRRASTAASSDSIGRWSCRAVATRSAGMCRWTSICCSSERTQTLKGDVLLVSGLAPARDPAEISQR